MSFDTLLAKSPSIIYRPGGSPGGLVATTWAEVQSFIALRQGACIVYVDDSITSPALVPGASGVTECFGRVELRAYKIDSVDYSLLQIEDGATLSNLWMITDLEVLMNSQSATPSLSWSGTPTGGFLQLEQYGYLTMAATATEPGIVVPAGAEMLLGMDNGSVFANSAGTDFTVPAVSVPATATFAIAAYNNCYVAQNFVSGAGDAQLEYDNSSASFFFPQPGPPALPGLTGTYTHDQDWVPPTAAQVPYTPAVPGNWSPVPTQVAAALDQLATHAAAVPYAVIWRPGGVASGNVVTTWAGVQAAIASASGAVAVYVDTSISAAAVGAGATDCQGRVTFQAATVDGVNPTLMIVPDGAVLKGPLAFSNTLSVVCQGKSAPNLEFAGNTGFLLSTGAAILNAGSQPLFTVVAGQTVAAVLGSGSQIIPSATGAVASLAGAGATLTVSLRDVAGFGGGNNVVTGGAGASFDLNYDASFPLSQVPTNPGFTGSTSIQIVDLAQSTSYTPAVPANWPVPPTQVAQALDELAAQASAELSTFIFRAGAVSSGNMFGTAAEIATELGKVNGAALVFLDASLGPCVLSAGVTWNFGGYGSIAGIQGTPPILTVQDTAQLLNLREVRGAQILCEPTTTPSLAFTAAQSVLWMTEEAVLQLSAAATIPAITLSAGFVLGIGLESAARIVVPAGANPLISMPGGGKTNFFAFQLVAPIPANAVSGTTGTLVYLADASGFPAPAWSLFTGTITSTLIDNAAGVKYSPAVPANWRTPPTQAAQALDELAAPTTFELVFTATTTNVLAGLQVSGALPSTGTARIALEGFGGGGGGGGGTDNPNIGYAGGGGGGALYQSQSTDFNLADRLDIIVGVGGAGGPGAGAPGSPGTNGSDGGTTYALDFNTSTLLIGLSGASGGQGGAQPNNQFSVGAGGACIPGGNLAANSSVLSPGFGNFGSIAAGGFGGEGQGAGFPQAGQNGNPNLSTRGQSPPSALGYYLGGTGGLGPAGSGGGGGGGGAGPMGPGGNGGSGQPTGTPGQPGTAAGANTGAGGGGGAGAINAAGGPGATGGSGWAKLIVSVQF